MDDLDNGQKHCQERERRNGNQRNCGGQEGKGNADRGFDTTTQGNMKAGKNGKRVGYQDKEQQDQHADGTQKPLGIGILNGRGR